MSGAVHTYAAHMRPAGSWQPAVQVTLQTGTAAGVTLLKIKPPPHVAPPGHNKQDWLK